MIFKAFENSVKFIPVGEGSSKMKVASLNMIQKNYSVINQFIRYIYGTI